MMKLDIQGYFMSIDRNVLLDISLGVLEKSRNREAKDGMKWCEILDYDLIRYLTEVIVMHDPVKNCIRRGKASDWDGLPDSKSLFHSKDGCGLPIGNLTSQLFSNVLLNQLDQYVKRELHCRHYGRYVDDMFFVDTDKKHLINICKEVKDFLDKELKLTIHPNKIQVVEVHQGVEFLGQYVMPNRRYISNHSRRRINSGIAQVASQETIEPGQLQAMVNSYCGVLSHVRAHRYWIDTIRRNNWLFRFGVFGIGMRNLSLFKSIAINQKICN